MSNFNLKLFTKQIDLKSSLVLGGAGSTGCSETEYSYSNGSQSDSTTTNYNEDGTIKSTTHCESTGCVEIL